jgi:O-antigen ligase
MNFLLAVLCLISFIAIPFFYGQRMTSGIFRADFYLLWATGCFCWLYVAFTQFKFNRIARLFLLGCLYILSLCLLKSRGDENSIYAFLTFLCCIGITRYLQTISLTKYHILIIASIVATYSVQVCFGYFQAIQNSWQGLAINGWLYNSGFFANYLASVVPLFLAGVICLTGSHQKSRIFFLVIFLAGLCLLTMTTARAAIIGTSLGSFFVVFACQRKINIKWVLLFAILITVPFIVFLYKLKPASALGRLTIYRVAVNMIKDHPLTGVGPNRFSARYNNYQSDFFKTEHSTIGTQLLADNTFEAFNSIIQMLVEYGIIGFLLLVLAGYYLLRKQKTATADPQTRWIYIGSWGCIISIIASSLFSNPFHVTPILLIFCYHLSVVLPQRSPSLLLPSKRHLFQLVSAVVFSLVVLTYVVVHHGAEKKWNMASRVAVYDNFNKAKRFYEDAYPYLKSNGDFLYNYGAEACLAGNYKLAIDLLTRASKYNSFSNLFVYLGDAYAATGHYDLAERNYLHGIYIAPSHIFPKFQLIQLYKKWRKPERARSWTIRTLHYPIKVRSDFVEFLVKELKKDI